MCNPSLSLFRPAQYKESTERFAKRIEKLQIAQEKLQYEKDVSWYEQHESSSKLEAEIEVLKAALEAKSAKEKRNDLGFALRNPYKFWKLRRQEKRRERELYRKKLIISGGHL